MYCPMLVRDKSGLLESSLSLLRDFEDDISTNFYSKFEAAGYEFLFFKKKSKTEVK